eukprot:s12626_g1.t1
MQLRQWQPVEKADANVEFQTVAYDKVMSTAQQAEIANLDKKKQEYASVATKAATFAAGKLHCFIGHLREANLLSNSFSSLMETWQELDACDNAASRLKPVQHDTQKQFTDTQVDVQADTLVEN